MYITKILIVYLIIGSYPNNDADKWLNTYIAVNMQDKTMDDIVELLRNEYCIPISYIKNIKYINKISLNNNKIKLKELLKYIVKDSVYEYKNINNHLIIYDKDPKYIQIVKAYGVNNMERFAAVYKLFDSIRMQFPEFSDLLAPLIRGNRNAILYTEKISFKDADRTIIENFMLLLGNNNSLYLSIMDSKYGQPAMGIQEIAKKVK